MTSHRRIGWLLALDPISESAVAWTLLRREEGERAVLVSSGITPGMTDVRTGVEAALPVAEGDPPDGLWSGTLCEPKAELELAVTAGLTLLPPVLRSQLQRDGIHTVNLATRGWLARVPWDCLSLTEQGNPRLIERATVLASFPAAAQVGRARRPAQVRDELRAIKLIDPGRPDDKSLGPIYPGLIPEDWYRANEGGAQVFTADDQVDADMLGTLLNDPKRWSRLMYFGHVVPGSASAPAQVALVLHDQEISQGLSAFRWLSAPERWPAPRRVALVGCGTNDSHFLEQSGLSIAAYNAGADLVTTTRWTLPVRDSVGRVAATTALALAVDAAHQQDDPAASLRCWQLERLRAWRLGADPADAPVLWSSLCTWYPPAGPHD
jgi:hypothetical protein